MKTRKYQPIRISDELCRQVATSIFLMRLVTAWILFALPTYGVFPLFGTVSVFRSRGLFMNRCSSEVGIVAVNTA